MYCTYLQSSFCPTVNEYLSIMSPMKQLIFSTKYFMLELVRENEFFPVELYSEDETVLKTKAKFISQVVRFCFYLRWKLFCKSLKNIIWPEYILNYPLLIETSLLSFITIYFECLCNTFFRYLFTPVINRRYDHHHDHHLDQGMAGWEQGGSRNGWQLHLHRRRLRHCLRKHHLHTGSGHC